MTSRGMLQGHPAHFLSLVFMSRQPCKPGGKVADITVFGEDAGISQHFTVHGIVKTHRRQTTCLVRRQRAVGPVQGEPGRNGHITGGQIERRLGVFDPAGKGQHLFNTQFRRPGAIGLFRIAHNKEPQGTSL